MPGPQYLSVSPGLAAAPDAVDWTQLARTVSDFYAARSDLRGIPYSWISSIDKRADRTVAKGHQIRDPLKYRLSCLTNGIILLQEAKFITDVYENALRFSAANHVYRCEPDLAELAASVPGKGMKVVPNKDHDSISTAFLGLTSYQLTDLIARHWSRLPEITNSRLGFRTLFWKYRRCRDVGLFRRDAKTIRNIRNFLAHSTMLPTQSHVEQLCARSRTWLRPLEVDIDGRIRDYRRRRPRFLEGFEARS